MLDFKDIEKRLIAVDTEYLSDDTSIKRRIKKVFCVCATNSDGKEYSKWIIEQNQPDILEEISSYFGIEGPIFVCHAYELAERQAFKALNAEPDKYTFLDTFHIDKLLTNEFSNKVYGHSLVEVTKRYLKIQRDCEEKATCRQLCIWNLTEGSEDRIMKYCLEDVHDLIPILKVQVEKYTMFMNHAYVLGNADITLPPIEALFYQCDMIRRFAKIADRGLPVDNDYVEKLIVASKKEISRLQGEFASKYPDVLQLGRDNKYHVSNVALQNHINDIVNSDLDKYSEYPRTTSGKWSTKQDDLNKYFKGTGNMLDEYRHLNNTLTQLRGVSGEAKTNWLSTWSKDDSRLYYRSLNPFGSATGRCQPSISKGFVFGWAHYLYGIMAPSKGKWLVECDFHSEETAIQAALTRDDNYVELYKSKDIYLDMCDRLGLIDHEAYTTRELGSLKEEYANIRKKIKTFFLASSYGCGVNSLALKSGLSLAQAEETKFKLENEILKTYSSWKKRLIKASLSNKGTKYGFRLPNGWSIRTSCKEADDKVTSIGNWPFQATGSFILQECIRRVQDELPEIEIVATIHDAIAFQVDAGRNDLIEKVSKIMKETADKILKIDYMGVGDADIVKEGEHFFCEDRDKEKFERLISIS